MAGVPVRVERQPVEEEGVSVEVLLKVLEVQGHFQEVGTKGRAFVDNHCR